MTITFLMDEKEITVEDGQTLLEAARENGIDIPTICFHEATTSNALCRICVVEVEDQAHALFNPEIVAREGKIKWEEGCLSIPDVYGWVERSQYVKVRAMDRNGETIEGEGTDLMAVCLQHEIDHLHGKLFIDHLSFLKRRTALAAWEKEKGKYPDGLRILQPGDSDGRPATADEG